MLLFSLWRVDGRGSFREVIEMYAAFLFAGPPRIFYPTFCALLPVATPPAGSRLHNVRVVSFVIDTISMDRLTAAPYSVLLYPRLDEAQYGSDSCCCFLHCSVERYFLRRFPCFMLCSKPSKNGGYNTKAELFADTTHLPVGEIRRSDTNILVVVLFPFLLRPCSS